MYLVSMLTNVFVLLVESCALFQLRNLHKPWYLVGYTLLAVFECLFDCGIQRGLGDRKSHIHFSGGVLVITCCAFVPRKYPSITVAGITVGLVQ